MEMNKLLLAICTYCFLFLSGCSTYGTLIEENKNNILKISPGHTKKEVVEIMGTRDATISGIYVSNPYHRDLFTLDNNEYEVLYYLTRKYPAFTTVRVSQATPIIIKNGKVTGIGAEALKKVKGDK